DVRRDPRPRPAQLPHRRVPDLDFHRVPGLVPLQRMGTAGACLPAGRSPRARAGGGARPLCAFEHARDVARGVRHRCDGQRRALPHRGGPPRSAQLAHPVGDGGGPAAGGADDRHGLRRSAVPHPRTRLLRRDSCGQPGHAAAHGHGAVLRLDHHGGQSAGRPHVRNPRPTNPGRRGVDVIAAAEGLHSTGLEPDAGAAGAGAAGAGAAGAGETVARARARGPWRKAWDRFKRNRLALISLVMCGVLVVVAFAAPWIAPHHYADTDYEALLAGAGADGHLLGTDQLGRDILSRTLYGLRTALIVAFGAELLALLCALVVGLAAGYRG